MKYKLMTAFLVGITILSIAGFSGEVSAESKQTSSNLNDLFKGWKSENSTSTVESNVNDSVYLRTAFPSRNAMFKNFVSINNTEHTYSYSFGDSTTSPYYSKDVSKESSNTNEYISNAVNDVKYYSQINKNGNKDLAKVITYTNAIQIAETVSLNIQTRSFDHESIVRNGSNDTLDKKYYGTYLDTMLDDADDIGIYAEGTGGIYIQNSELKLFCKPLSNNVKIIAGHYAAQGHLNDPVEVTNQTSGTPIVSSGDSAIQYELKEPVSLGKNEIVKYSYSESLYAQEEINDPTWPNGDADGWKNFAGKDLELLNDPENSLFGEYTFYSPVQVAIYKTFEGADEFVPGKYQVTVFAKPLESESGNLPLKVSLKQDHSSGESRTLLLKNINKGKKVDKGYYKLSAEVTLDLDEVAPLIIVENYQGGYITNISITPIS